MSDIIDEIQQDIKDEKYANLWKKYGNIVIGMAVSVVIGTGISVWWKDKQQAKDEALGNQLFEAVMNEQEGNTTEALSMLKGLSGQQGEVSSVIAGLRQAALLAQENKHKDAFEFYQRVWADPKAPSELKELAELQYLNLAINSKELEVPSTDIESKLENLSREGAPWRYSALELSAFYAFDQGQKGRAEELFEALAKEVNAPARIRSRANEMVKAIGS